MAARKGPSKLYRYSAEFKLKAVKLSQLEGVRVQEVADALEIQKRYKKWKDIAIISGAPGLRAIRGFRDEALSGQWKRYRSSRLSLKYRLIYRVVASELLFQVVEMTPHDDRRR